MSGELEAAGALATAGLVGAAIDGREPGEAVDGACLNCGTKLEGRFCSQCGQSAHPHRTLVGVFEEFLHGVLHFDTKAWRTLPMVIFRPGTLTRNYVYGKRARYISPLALFLFSIFTMFVAFAFIETPVGLNGTPTEQRAEAIEELEQARAEVAEAERELAAVLAAPPPTDGTPVDLPERMARLELRLAQEEAQRREQAVARIDAAQAARTAEAQSAPATAPTPDAAAPAPTAEAPAAETQPEDAETPAAPSQLGAGPGPEGDNIGWGPDETWQDGVARAARERSFVTLPGMPELNERINKKLENPDLALYKVQQTAYKFSFLLVPISLPFIALLFLWKRGTTFYDHVVYALYALSFASILLITIIIASHWTWTSWVIGWLLGIGLPVHTFFHLKGSYKLGWWSALWRTIFMLFFAIFALTFFLVAIFLLGLGTG